MISQKEISEIIPDAISPSGRALWSPNTCVVNPQEVLNLLQRELTEKGVKFFFNMKKWKLKLKIKSSYFNGNKISFGHIINATGLQADKVAYKFGIGKQYSLLPFKGYIGSSKKFAF